jgi:hypothetical protein
LVERRRDCAAPLNTRRLALPSTAFCSCSMDGKRRKRAATMVGTDA